MVELTNISVETVGVGALRKLTTTILDADDLVLAEALDLVPGSYPVKDETGQPLILVVDKDPATEDLVDAQNWGGDIRSVGISEYLPTRPGSLDHALSYGRATLVYERFQSFADKELARRGGIFPRPAVAVFYPGALLADEPDTLTPVPSSAPTPGPSFYGQVPEIPENFPFMASSSQQINPLARFQRDVNLIVSAATQPNFSGVVSHLELIP